MAAAEGFAVSPENVLIIKDPERGLSSAMITGIRCVIEKNEFTEPQVLTDATAKIDAPTHLAVTGLQMTICFNLWIR